MRNLKIKNFKKILLVLSLLMILTGCWSKLILPEDLTSPTETPLQQVTEENGEVPKKDEKNLLKVAMSYPKTLNPLYNTEKSVEQALHLIFSTLINVEEDGSVTPNIATHWEIDYSNHSVLLTLRSDVKWHDGTNLTAEDVKFSLETLQKVPESAYKACVENLGTIEVVDPMRIKLFYKSNFSGVLQTLCFPIIPKHIYEGVQNQLVPSPNSENPQKEIAPVGSGPYRFKDQIELKEIHLERNPYYFKGQPKIEAITIQLISDEETILHAFEQNLIDVVYTDVMDWGKYAKNKSTQVVELSTNLYEFIGLNSTKPLFQGEKVRKALVYALDRQSLLDIYYLGHGNVADTPINPASYLFDPSFETLEQDKEKVKVLLAQEGYYWNEQTKAYMKNGVPLAFSILVNGENAQRLKVAKAIQEMYEESGIKVTLNKVDEATYKSKIYNKDFEAFLGGWKISYIPDLSFAFHSSQILGGENFISYKDEALDQLLQQAFQADVLQIQGAYSKLQSYFIDKNPYISLYFRNSALILNHKVTGDIKLSPLNIYTNIEEWAIE